MNKMEIIKKMQKLRETMELDFFKSELDDNTNKCTRSVANVKYLGQIEMDGKSVAIFLLLEQVKDRNGNVVFETENYYTEDGEIIGKYLDEYDVIAIKEEYKEIDGLYQNLNRLDKNGKIDLEKVEKSQLKQIAEALGIEKDEIDSMSSIDLVQKIEQKQDTNNKEDTASELNKEQTKKITDGKQEIKLGIRVDEYKTLGQALELNESEYSKVIIVYSEKLKEIQDGNQPINNTAYSFVAIKKDGTAEVINDRLKIDERSGNNSYKEAIKIDANKRARRDDKTKTRFQIVGKDGKNEGKSVEKKETLSVENGQYGEIKAYYGKGRTIEGQMNIETQLETSNIKPTSVELRRLQADRKGIYNNDKMAQEGNKYFENGDEDVSMYSVDGDGSTLNLSDYIEKNKDDIIAKIMENDVIANSQFGEKDIEDKLEKVIKEDDNKNYTLKEINEKIDEIEEEIAEDAGYFPTRNRR